MKPTSILIILLFAFALAACGGGGSSGPAPAPMPTTYNVDLGDLMLADGTEAGEHMIAAGESMDIGGITFTCPAGNACTLMIAADGTVTSTGGMVTAMAAIPPEPPGPGPDENKAEAMRIAGLIDPMSERPDANTSTGDQGLSIVSLSTPPMDDNFSEPQFQTTDGTTVAAVEFMASDDMPAMIEGWTGGTYTHTSEDGNTMHTVVKYNDKAADEGEAYSTFFSATNTASTTVPGPHRASVAVDSVSTGTTAGGDTVVTGILTIDIDGISGNHGLFAGTTFPGASNSETTYTGAQSITGMFRGVLGTYKCPANCTSTKDMSGNLSELDGVWTFVPTVVDGLDATDTAEDGELAMIVEALEDLMVPGVKQDADYMIFGYWLESVTADGETTEKMLPFADGKRDYGAVGSTRTDAVEGTATYTGPATGLYMKKTLTPQGTVNQDGPFASGQFTADAMLKANFGGGDIGANHQYSIMGTISNFMDGDTVIDEDWKVNLNRPMDNETTTGTDESLNIAQDTGTFAGGTDGGMLDDASNVGAWSGTFHGDPAADQPTSASGIFDAHFTNGHVRGAFATNIVEDE